MKRGRGGDSFKEVVSCNNGMNDENELKGLQNFRVNPELFRERREKKQFSEISPEISDALRVSDRETESSHMINREPVLSSGEGEGNSIIELEGRELGGGARNNNDDEEEKEKEEMKEESWKRDEIHERDDDNDDGGDTLRNILTNGRVEESN